MLLMLLKWGFVGSSKTFGKKRESHTKKKKKLRGEGQGEGVEGQGEGLAGKDKL